MERRSLIESAKGFSYLRRLRLPMLIIQVNFLNQIISLHPSCNPLSQSTYKHQFYMESTTSTVSIIKSPSDKREYRHVRLTNGLEALIVHDSEADKSAAALDVKVGCSLDPKTHYGTAHFLEHMLFMGTQKYP